MASGFQLSADDQHGRRLVYLGLVALAKTVGLRRNARELLWRAFRLRALTALRLMATMLREKGVVRSSNRARAAVGDGAFIAYLKARGLCALRRFPQRFREAGANAKVVEFNCARFGELWNRSVVSHHPQIRIAMKLLYKQVFSSRDERARWTLADSGRRRIPAVALLKRWMHKARRVDDGTYVPSTPNPKHESIIQVSTDMAAPASLNRGGVLIRVMSRLLARWANAAVSAVRFRTAYERADFAFSLKLTIKSWDLLKMTVAARKYYWHVSEVQSLINYRRNLFMRFSRRIAVAQSLFTRSDRRIRRAAKYHRRRCLLRCLRLWHRRKRQADRALLATAALSRSSVRLLRESKKQEYRERSLAAKYR